MFFHNYLLFSKKEGKKKQFKKGKNLIPMNKKIKITLEVISCIIIIAFLISKLNISKAVHILLTADIRWILVGIGIYICSIFIMGYSLKVLFDSVKYTPFLEWMRFYLIGFSTGLVLPGRAGDLSIIYFAKQKDFDIGASTALTIIDKLITLIIFGVLAAIGVFTILNSSQLYFGLALTIFCILIGASLFTTTGRKTITKILGKYAEKFTGFYKTFKNVMQHHKDKVIINTIITLYRPIGNALLMLVILKSFGGGDVPFFYLIIINAITLIVSLIPLTPNGIGIREGVGGFLFTQIGIPLEISLSMYLIILLMNYGMGIIGTSYYLITKKNPEANNSHVEEGELP